MDYYKGDRTPNSKVHCKPDTAPCICRSFFLDSVFTAFMADHASVLQISGPESAPCHHLIQLFLFSLLLYEVILPRFPSPVGDKRSFSCMCGLHPEISPRGYPSALPSGNLGCSGRLAYCYMIIRNSCGSCENVSLRVMLGVETAVMPAPYRL